MHTTQYTLHNTKHEYTAYLYLQKYILAELQLNSEIYIFLMPCIYRQTEEKIPVFIAHNSAIIMGYLFQVSIGSFMSVLCVFLSIVRYARHILACNEGVR